MTQEVNTEQFYLVGKNLFDMAATMYEAFDINVKILGETGSMAGTDDAGAAWAASYDSRARELLDAVNDLNTAMENYGGVIIQAGYNHELAEHNATVGNRGPAPVMPQLPPSVAGVLSAPPSAGGPGQGLFDDAIGLVEQIGIPVPDGDTDKIDKAAQAWDRLATVYQTTRIVGALGVQAQMFNDTTSPEVEYIANDLTELHDAASAILDGCAELSQSCTEYKSALDDLRQQLEGLLEDLAIELGITAVIAVAASFLSFGAGAVAGTAKAADSIRKFAALISTAISSWKISKNISKGVKRAHDIAGIRKRLDRIKNLGRKRKRDENTPGGAGTGSEAARLARESVDDKLNRYLLNPDHPIGGPKAKWFEDALGFTRENASDLANQIVFNEGSAVETGVTQHGTKYNQVIPITGANGKTIDVLFAWIRNNDGVVRLVTAIPASR